MPDIKNLTESEIMQLVDKIHRLLINLHVPRQTKMYKHSCYNEIGYTKAELQAIAKEYVERGKQRDKLLKALKDVSEALWVYEDSHIALIEADELIAECEEEKDG